MSDSGRAGVELSHAEQVALYVLLAREESRLDTLQREVLDRIAGVLYDQLSVTQMEDIEGYYESLRQGTREG